MKTFSHLLYLAEFFLRWDVSDKRCRENQNARFMFNNFLEKSWRLWGNVGKCSEATDENIIQRMRFACWITKATDARSLYVILIAFPRQHLFRESAAVSRYTCIAYLVVFCSALREQRTRHGLFLHRLVLVSENLHLRGALSSSQGETSWRSDTCDFTQATERSFMDLSPFYRPWTVTLPPPLYFQAII